MPFIDEPMEAGPRVPGMLLPDPVKAPVPTVGGVLAAAARVLGVPARLGFADVRNHLTSPRLREMMNTDVFAYHGYTELLIDGRWQLPAQEASASGA